MHTGTNDTPRLGYAKGGKIQCMAEGGLVQQIKAGLNKLVGNNPTAMAQRGRSETADAPPPTTSTTEPVPKAKGGSIPKPPKGAAPHPEAIGTDTVPIMGTPGEFMVRKPAVDKIEAVAPGLLNALNAMGDDKPKLGQVKRKRRGKRKGYALGGPVMFDEYRNPRPAGGPPPVTSGVPQTPNTPAPYVNHRAPSGPPAMPPPLALPNNAPPPANAVATVPRQGFVYGPGVAPNQPPSGVTDVTPRMSRPSGPLALPAPSGNAVPPPAAPPAVPQVDVQRQAWQGRTGSPQAEAWQAEKLGRPTAGATPATAAPAAAVPPAAPQTRLGRVARTVGNAVGPTGVALSAIPEVMDTASVAMNPNATFIDTLTQGAQGMGRVGFAGAGAAGGAALGALTGPLAPVAIPLGAIAGGAAGYFGADKAIEAGRNAVGVDPRAPVERLGAVQKPGAIAAAPAVQAPYPETAGMHTIATPADPAAVAQAVANPANPAGAVTRIGNSYSGAPGISGDIAINGKTAGGGFVRGSGDGTFKYGGGNSGVTASNLGGNDQALFDARMAAVQRGDASSVAASYGGNFGPKVDPIEALINNGRPMTQRKAAAIAQLQEARARGEGATAGRALDAQRFALDKESADLTNREKKGLLSAQDAYANAKTPAEKASAEERLRAMQGKYEKEPTNRFTVVPGGQEMDASGVPVTRPASVINNQTGEFVQQPSAPRALPPGLKVGAPTKQADGTYNAAGKTVVIKGGKVTEIK